MPIPPNFGPEAVQPLEQRHRDAILDLVLAWAGLDDALTVFLAPIFGIPLAEFANRYGQENGSTKLQAVSVHLRQAPAGEQWGTTFRKVKKRYERHSKLRNRIAHSRCVGVSAEDPDYIVFRVCQKHGDDALAVEAISIQAIKAAAKWGEKVGDHLLLVAEKIEAATSKEPGH